MMYIHAYQSYVWNAIVSERIKRYGHEAPVLGDIVYDDEKSGDEDEAEQPMEQSIRGTLFPAILFFALYFIARSWT